MKVTLVGAGRLGTQLYAKLTCIEEIQFVEWYIRSSKKNKTNEGIIITNDAKKLKLIFSLLQFQITLLRRCQIFFLKILLSFIPQDVSQ